MVPHADPWPRTLIIHPAVFYEREQGKIHLAMSRIHHHNFVLRPAAPEALEHHVKLHAESTGNKPNIIEVADGVAGTPNEQGTSTMSEARNTYAECATSRTPWFLTLLK